MASLIFVVIAIALFYLRASLTTWSCSIIVYLIAISFFNGISFPILLFWFIAVGFIAIFNVSSLRFKLFTQPVYKFAKGQLPTISKSEQEALDSGTVSWEGELFSGNLDWNKLYSYKPMQLTSEEKTFLEGPAEEICKNKHSPWDMWHKDLNFRQDLLEFINKNGFVALVIPKEYGGKGFSVFATWQIILKISKSIGPLINYVGIANSIGAGELIEHYGTDAQKKKYLPKLANGSERPCFALTSPVAGSDATSIEDYGVVCKGTFEGKEVLGVKLNFNKRYITMAPTATLISLAFKLYDPDQLLGKKENIGVSLALVSTNLPGVTHGRRHYPVGAAFPNGPLKGTDVFIPIDNLLGGEKMMGRAWEMLTQALATGRATSLPTVAASNSKTTLYLTTVYSLLRKQFGRNIGSFEGVQEKLAEMAGYTYLSDALRLFTFSQIHAGERPAIPAAISKYNTTELARRSATIAIDLMGGKGVIQGPNNHVAMAYLSAPVAVTIEGSNTLTRSLIVFGQGAVRCHPYILKEMKALETNDLVRFDSFMMSHAKYTLSNHARSFLLAVTNGYIAKVPSYNDSMKRYHQKLARLCSSFALLSDITMISLGGKLKFMESLSGRFADAFSMLFINSAIIKHYHDKGYNEETLPLVEWSLQWSLYNAEKNLYEILDNLPNRIISVWLKFFIFPLGRRYKTPSDKLNHSVAQLVQSSKSVREELANGLFLTPTPTNPISQYEDALEKATRVENLDSKIYKQAKAGLLKGYTYLDRVENAKKSRMISKEEETSLLKAYEAVMNIVNVDDFSLTELHEQK